MTDEIPALFDCNGVFGRAASGVNECPTMRERLAHMDRLGIARSLVWNSESIQNQAFCSNERLLAACAKADMASGRLFPALTVSGLALYERGGLEAFRRQMIAGRTRALRFVNVFGRMTLSQVEPVVRHVRALRPFIVMRHDAVSQFDLLDFTARLPNVPVILTDVMWGPCNTVFDLMRRRRNILLDISWLHTWDAVALAVKHFGAERVVFGTGYRSHNGAAIAALARASIGAKARELIAHGNLDRLMGLKPGPARIDNGAPSLNSLWKKFVGGNPIGADCVDAHAHLGPSAGYVLAVQDEDGQVAEARRALKETGVRLMLFSGLQALLGDPVSGNDLLAEKLRGHPGCFAAYAAFNPLYAGELEARFKSYFSNPVFIGFKTLCDYWRVPITDRRFDPMWRCAERLRLPMLMHSWGGQFDAPGMIDGLAAKYRSVSFILAHSGGNDSGRGQAEDMAKKHPNVYLEWCGSFCSSRQWKDTIAAVGSHKIVFGTDAMAHGIDWEMGRLLSLDAAESDLKAILGANMRRILARRRQKS